MSSKREQIIEAATRIMFEKGIQGASMDEIAADVPVSKMTIYKYFQHKSGLVSAVLQGYFQQLQAHMNKMIEQSDTPLDALLGMMSYQEMTIPEQFLKECLERHPHYVEEMMQFYREHVAAKLEGLIFEGQQQGYIRKDISPHLLMLYVESMKQYLARPEVMNNMHDFRSIGEQFQTILLHGIVAPEHHSKS